MQIERKTDDQSRDREMRDRDKDGDREGGFSMEQSHEFTHFPELTDKP